MISLACSVVLAAPEANFVQADNSTLLQEANDFFRQAGENADPDKAAELYTKALRRYEHITHNGMRNGKLYYNIGNAYFRLHSLGRAILNYRKAHRYLPNDENVNHNLAFALSQQPDKIIPKQETQIMKTLLFWHYDLSSELRWWIFGVAYLIFWLMIFIRLMRGGRSPGLASLLPLLFAFLMGTSLLADHFWPPKPAGVLVASEVVARKGDGLSYLPSFTEPLHAGLDFSLVEKRNSWLLIELRDGRHCWVPEDSAALIVEVSE